MLESPKSEFVGLLSYEAQAFEASRFRSRNFQSESKQYDISMVIYFIVYDIVHSCRRTCTI